MRKLFVIISLVVFVASLPWLFVAYRLPAKVESETALLNYEHEGRFDYLVHLKPSYLFGPPPQEPLPNPRYPAEIVETIDFTFSYSPVEPTPEVASVEAVLENPGIWQKKIKLAPSTSTNGDITLRFSLDIDEIHQLFDDIEGEIKITAPTRNVTINACVTAPGGQFVYSLPIKLGKTLIEVDSNLRHTQPCGVGTFGYTVQLKSNMEIPSNPKYPAEIVDTIEFVFAYVPVQKTSGLACVDAVLENPGIWQKKIELVSTSSKNGDFTLRFSLDIDEIHQLFDNIEKEIGVTTPTRNVTINAYYLASDGQRFAQSLPIKLDKPLIEVDSNLTQTKPSGTGTFDYIVYLKPNSIYGATTLKPPAPVTPSTPTFEITLEPAPSPALPSSTTLKPGQVVFSKLVDRMDVTFYYRFKSDRQVNKVTTDVEITAVVEAAELWSKEFPVLYTRNKGGDFEVSFPLDLVYYLELLETIRAETGASGESNNVIVIANVHTVAETEFGLIDETFSQAMKGTLRGNVLEWDELAKTEPGSIEETRLIPNPNKYLGLSVAEARVLSTALAGIFFLCFVGYLVLYVRFKPAEPLPAEKEALRVKKKYRELMAEATGQTPIEGEKIISLGSMEDLITVANELGKPIIHQATGKPQEPHAYYVFDAATRYQYVLVTNGKEAA